MADILKKKKVSELPEATSPNGFWIFGYNDNLPAGKRSVKFAFDKIKSLFGVTQEKGQSVVLAPSQKLFTDEITQITDIFSITGYYVSRGSGELVQDAGYKSTTFLPVKELFPDGIDEITITGYIGGVAGIYVLYDEFFERIDYDYPTNKGQQTVTIKRSDIPANAEYTRCTSAIATSLPGKVEGIKTTITRTLDEIYRRDSRSEIFNVSERKPTGNVYDRRTARLAVPRNLRKSGLRIAYQAEDGWHFEKYIGDAQNYGYSDTSWVDDSYSARQTLTQVDGFGIAMSTGDVFADTTDRGHTNFIQIVDGMSMYRYAVLSGNKVNDTEYAAMFLYDSSFTYIGYLTETSSGNVKEKYTFDLTSIWAKYPTAKYFKTNIFNKTGFNIVSPNGSYSVISDQQAQKIKIEKNKFGIIGYTHKSSGILITDTTAYRTTPFLILDSSPNLIITGWSGLTNGAALVLCFDQYRNYLGYVNADTNGLVVDYVLPKTSLIKDTVYIKCNATSGQTLRKVIGADLIINNNDLQNFIINSAIQPANDSLSSSEGKISVNVANGSGDSKTRPISQKTFTDISNSKIAKADIQKSLGQSDNPISQKAVTDIFNSKIAKTDIQKSLGQSDNPISQKAVTDAINNAKIPVVDNLNSMSISASLSANQGHILNQKIGANASGTPKGFYQTLSALNGAIPTGNDYIYITLDNGNWNYWNGSAWQSGGLYQTSMGDVDKVLTITESIEHANTNDYLTFKNYLGNSENIHPKVLYFANGLWGYKYWMAYTPYPLGVVSAENPCIAVSNDGVNWSVPNGLVNPLIGQPPNNGYNSDTHLVYREDINTLECWYRPVKVKPTLDAIVRKTTTNGLDWSDEEIVIDYGTKYNNILSPAVVFEEGKYKMWYCDAVNVIYRETTGSSMGSWTAPITLAIEWGTLKAWHLDVINNGKDGYDMVVCAFTPEGSNNAADLYHVKQLYNGEFTKPVAILNRSKNPNAIDYRSIYRSCIVLIDNTYYLYYSCIDNGWHRYMALAYGSNILGLNGYKPTNFNSNGYLLISEDKTLTDFDVDGIDLLIVQGSITITIESFINAFIGKQLNLVVVGSNAKINLINNNQRLVLPGLVNKEININNMGAVLVFTGTNQARCISLG